MTRSSKKTTITATIDKKIWIKLHTLENFNLSSFINHMLTLKFNNDDNGNPDKIALEKEIGALESKTNKMETELYKKKIQLQELEENERIKQEQDQEESEALVRGLKANNPLRDIQ